MRYFHISRSSHGTCSVKKGVLKKRLKHKCFPVNIVKFLITRFLKYICERVLLYFLKSELQKYNSYTSRKLLFQFQDLQNIFLPVQLYKLQLHRIYVLFCIILAYYFQHFSQHFYCFVLHQLKEIKRFQSTKICSHRQCAEPEFRLDLAKLCSRDKYCTTASLIKVPLLKMGVYLILEVHNMLFTDLTLVANEWKVKYKHHK